MTIDVSDDLTITVSVIYGVISLRSASEEHALAIYPAEIEPLRAALATALTTLNGGAADPLNVPA